MLWSRTCAYALQAMVRIAALPEKEYVRAHDLAFYLEDVPSPYLSKILQGLAADGLLVSQKGKGGGFLLAPGVRDLRLLEVVRRIEGSGYGDACVLGLAKCADETPCPAHHAWKPMKRDMMGMLDSRTLGEIAEKVRDGSYDLQRFRRLLPAV